MEYREKGKPVVAKYISPALVVVSSILAIPTLLFFEQKEEGCILGSKVAWNISPPIIIDIYMKIVLPLILALQFIVIAAMSVQIITKLRSSRAQFGRPEKEAAVSLLSVCVCFLVLNIVFLAMGIAVQMLPVDDEVDKKRTELLVDIAVSTKFFSRILQTKLMLLPIILQLTFNVRIPNLDFSYKTISLRGLLF